MRPLRLILAITLLTGGVVHPADAQTGKRAEVSAGYSFMHDAPSNIRFPIGWTVGAAGAIMNWFSVVAELDATHRTTATLVGDVSLGVQAVMVGGRASAKIGRLVEFGQLLVGVVHGTATVLGMSSASTELSGQAGAGLDFPLKGNVAARAEIDFRLIRPSEPGGEVGRQFRVVGSAVYTFYR